MKALFWQTIAKANASERKFLGFCPLNTTLPARTERRCSAEKQLQDMFVVFIVLQKVPRPTTAAAALWMKTARLKTAVSTGEGIGFQRAPCTNPTEIRALNALAAKDVAPSAWRSPVDRRAVNGNRSKANAASFDVLTPATTRSLQLSVSGWCVMHLDFSPVFKFQKRAVAHFSRTILTYRSHMSVYTAFATKRTSIIWVCITAICIRKSDNDNGKKVFA